MKKLIPLIILLFSILASRAQTTEEYIAQHFQKAQELMRIHQLPASIILAVAIHESAAGKSKIAKYLNNHFGVKGKNSSTALRSSYRDYPTVDSSYAHFVSFLQSRSYFNILFSKYDQYDFINWAKGIQRGGYAHSRSWAGQVIGLIRKYQLFKYDERPEGGEQGLSGIPTPVKLQKTEAAVIRKSKTYIVKKGDNLNQIAKRNGTTTAALMRKNQLISNLQPGQEITLVN